MNASTSPKTRANRTPATPAMIPPMAKVVTMTRSTLMPMRAAISLSCATARMDLPVFVLATNSVSATMATSAVMITIAFVRKMGMPRIFQWPFNVLIEG